MNKILTPTTIIPASLYVEREADRQLRSIVNEMGRPGYVLVARQMGKTNLLLNMKRERASDVVLYFDLSNRLDSARAWFRNIIDTLVESRNEQFADTYSQICDQRRGGSLSAGAEYDRHIRMLLRAIDCRVVIVLDEIDSLVSTPYSDAILAQIRSMYFSRANHPEYGRLTYVLSGVAEPSDLIKDKNISPFNIGEKIYLDDFNKSEFDEFISRSKLSIDASVVDRIFEWAQGNPRMTWDICSEVEDLCNLGRAVTTLDIDNAVDKLYLQNFDRAPIDHIRTLAESDSQVRHAIVAIRYGKTDVVDDKVKSRLYLAGITRSLAGGKVEIKNRIIDVALSDRWLDHVASARRSLLAAASENFLTQRYDEAIRQFEEVLSDASQSNDFAPAHRIELAYSYFWTGKTLRAVEEFKTCLSQTTDVALRQRFQLYLGLAMLASRSVEEGLQHLQQASEGPGLGFAIEAQANMVSAYVLMGLKQYGPDAKRLNEKVLEQIRASTEKEITQLLPSALYNQARLLIFFGAIEEAQQTLEEAQACASTEMRPAIQLFQFAIERDAQKRIDIICSIFDCVIGSALIPASTKVNTIGLTTEHLALTMAHLLALGLQSQASTLLSYIKSRVYRGQYNNFDTLLALYDEVSDNEKSDTALVLVQRALTHDREGTSVHSLLKAYRAMASNDASDSNLDWGNQFLKALSANVANDQISRDDLLTILQVVNNLFQRQEYAKIKSVFDIYRNYEQFAEERFRYEHTLLLFYEMTTFRELGSKDASSVVARKLMELTKPDQQSTNRGSAYESVIPEIRKRATEALGPMRLAADPFRKYGRNQKVVVQYGDEDPIERKFKVVEYDLRNGKCSIVNK